MSRDQDDVEADYCPNCGASPLDGRYIAHVESCTGEPPGIAWFWSQGWKGKFNVIFVTVTVIVLQVVHRAIVAIKEGFSD